MLQTPRARHRHLDAELLRLVGRQDAPLFCVMRACPRYAHACRSCQRGRSWVGLTRRLCPCVCVSPLCLCVSVLEGREPFAVSGCGRPSAAAGLCCRRVLCSSSVCVCGAAPCSCVSSWCACPSCVVMLRPGLWPLCCGPPGGLRGASSKLAQGRQGPGRQPSHEPN